MSERCSAGRERAAALLLFAGGLAASSWMHAEAARAVAATEVRARRLEHLATLSQPSGQRAVADDALIALDGLFCNQDVVWLRAPSGPVLTLVEIAGGDRP